MGVSQKACMCLSKTVQVFRVDRFGRFRQVDLGPVPLSHEVTYLRQLAATIDRAGGFQNV